VRDYSRFDDYLNRLSADIYSQPEDSGHTDWCKDAIELLPSNVNSVLDVGCGTGFAQDLLKVQSYTGITASENDRKVAREKKRNVRLGDMTYLTFNNESFDLIFARHVLEHSPFPILTLMEWYRVSRKYLLLVAPAPEYWNVHGRNHLSVAYKNQLWWYLTVAGWNIVKTNDMTTADLPYLLTYTDNNERKKAEKPLEPYPGPPQVVEYRFLCEKKL